MDDEGYLYIVDRRNDLIVSGGENIYPSEVEEALLKIKGIEDVGVTGIDDDKWGKVPIACIVGDEKITHEYIIASLKDTLAGYKIPKKVYFVESLPRNSSQKLMRGAMLSYIEQNNIIGKRK